MLMSLVPVGFGNFVSLDVVVAIGSYASSSIAKSVQEANVTHKLIDLTAGRVTKSVFFLVSGEIVLSALGPEVIARKVRTNGY